MFLVSSKKLGRSLSAFTLSCAGIYDSIELEAEAVTNNSKQTENIGFIVDIIWMNKSTIVIYAKV